MMRAIAGLHLLMLAACAHSPPPQAPSDPHHLDEHPLDPVTGKPSPLTKRQVVDGMAPMKYGATHCYDTYREPGLAVFELVVAPTGLVSSVRVVDGGLVGTHTAACIEAVIRNARFATFDGEPMTFRYPFMLR
jgi:hypothetical protein